MSASIDFQGPYTVSHRHHAPGTIKGHPAPYSTLKISDAEGSHVTLYFDTGAEVDGLIGTAAVVRDTLAAAHACGDIGERGDRFCMLAPGHVPDHGDETGTWPWAPSVSAGPEPALTAAEEQALDGWEGAALNLGGAFAPLPAGHGENHHDNAGHATHVTSGTRVPGCVTCEVAS